MAYEVCFYRDGRLVEVRPAKNRDQAELIALEGDRARVDTIIYRHGKAVRRDRR